LKKVYGLLQRGENKARVYESSVEYCHENGGRRCLWNISNNLRG